MKNFIFFIPSLEIFITKTKKLYKVENILDKRKRTFIDKVFFYILRSHSCKPDKNF